jgi:hypothetical protein
MVITSWRDSRSGEVSEVPIEDGSEIADHYIQHSDRLEIDCSVTNQPFQSGQEWELVDIDVRASKFVPHGLLAITEGITGAVNSLIGLAGLNPAKAWLIKPDSPKDYIQAFHDQLVKIKESVFECSLTYMGSSVSALILESIEKTRSADRPGGHFALSFRKIKKVQTRLFGLPVPTDLISAVASIAPTIPFLTTDVEAEVRKHSETSVLGGLL